MIDYDRNNERSFAVGDLVQTKPYPYRTKQTSTIKSIYVNELDTVIYCLKEGGDFASNEIELA